MRKAEATETEEALPLSPRAVLDALDRAILLVSSGGRVLDYNAAARAAVGCLLGRKIRRGARLDRYALPPELPEFAPLLRKALEEGRAERTVRLPREKGSPLHIRFVLSSLGDDREGPVLLEAEDVSERYASEAKRAHAARMEALGTLAGGVAHDFNNLLAVILGSLDLARNRLDRGISPLKDLDRIGGACLRARDLIRQILNFARARPEENSGILQPLPLIKETLKLLQASRPRGILLRTRFSEEAEAARIAMDPSRLQQIVLNLYANAVQAMEEEGTLTISADLAPPEGGEGRFRLVFADTGRGFDEPTAARIFDPFFTTKGDRGTGLGLAIVREALQEAGGEITARGIPGEGATFVLTLPLAARPDRGIADPREPIPRGRTERILLVEDDPSLAEVTEGVLRDLGYEVELFREADPARERLRNRPRDFDLVLLDASAPRRLEAFLDAVARLRPEIPLLLQSGTLTSEELPPGVRAFLPKPATPGELARAIRALLDGPALARSDLFPPQEARGGGR